MGKKSKARSKERAKKESKDVKKKGSVKNGEKKNNKAQSKTKSKNETRVQEYLLAKIDDNFIITNKYHSHYEWLHNEKHMNNTDIDGLVVGKLKIKDKDREIVLYTCESKGKMNRSLLKPNVVMNLHNICRDNVGVGNYKIYNGIKIDKETGKEVYMSSIMDFDVRKPVKHMD